MAKVKVIGNLDIKDLARDGAVYELEHSSPNDNPDMDRGPELEKHIESLEKVTKMECLYIEEDDSEEKSSLGVPFAKIEEKMKNLIPSGMIKKRIIREGYGECPEKGTNIKIHYSAYIEHEAIPFDSTLARNEPFSLVLGNGAVIEGLDIAVQSMKYNEKSEFLIDPEMAYKDSGLNRIPPNSRVLFDVEVLELTPKTNIENEVSKKDENDFENTYKYCLALANKGKTIFNLKDYEGAVKEYNKALRKMDYCILRDYNDQMLSDEFLIKLHTNLLVCHTIMEMPKRGCYHANKILNYYRDGEIKKSAKVFFNNAKCLRMLGDFKMARNRLKSAKYLEKDNEEIDEEFNVLVQAEDAYKKNQMDLARALLRSGN